MQPRQFKSIKYQVCQLLLRSPAGQSVSRDWVRQNISTETEVTAKVSERVRKIFQSMQRDGWIDRSNDDAVVVLDVDPIIDFIERSDAWEAKERYVDGEGQKAMA